MPHYDNLEGGRFDLVMVKKYIGMDKHRRALWECECDCGNYVVFPGATLKLTRKNNLLSCGCKPRNSHNIDIAGEKRGWLKIIKLASRGSTGVNAGWLCKCLRCGRKKEVSTSDLGRKGDRRIVSCGCHERDRRRKLPPEAYSIKNEGKRNRIYMALPYIKDQISKRTGIPYRDVTPGMIELKRKQLVFHREFKKLKEMIKNGAMGN